MRNDPSYEMQLCGRCGLPKDLDATLKLCPPCLDCETHEQDERASDHAFWQGLAIADPGVLETPDMAFKRQILEAARGHVPIGSVAKNPRPR